MRTVSKVAVPYMRGNPEFLNTSGDYGYVGWIRFHGENFKPNTRLYPFFNKTDVSKYTTPSANSHFGGSLGAGAFSSDSEPGLNSP